jgi:hypothetical protein
LQNSNLTSTYAVLILSILFTASCASRSVTIKPDAQAPENTEAVEPKSDAKDGVAPAEAAPAAEPKLSMIDQVTAKSVENLTPIEPNKEFEGVDRVFCFTKILGAETPTHVFHKWFYQDKEVASVKLDVTSQSFRTFSAKWIMRGALGDWKVKVVGPTGKDMGDIAFIVKPMSTAEAAATSK